MKILSAVFWIPAVLLSNVMSAAAAYNYCDMLWGIKYAGCSAPASTAFLTAVPYAAGAVICVVLAVVFGRKAERQKGSEKKF